MREPKLRTTSHVPSVEPPSMTMYSRSGYSCDSTDSMASLIVATLLKQTVMIDSDGNSEFRCVILVAEVLNACTPKAIAVSPLQPTIAPSRAGAQIPCSTEIIEMTLP